FDNILNFSSGQTVPCRLLPADLEIQVIASGDPLKECTACSRYRLQYSFELQSDFLDRLKIGPENLDSDGRPNSGRDHVDAGSDREKPRIGERGNLDRMIHLFDELLPANWTVFRPEAAKRWLEKFRAVLGIPTIARKVPPLLFGLQDNRGFHHAHG